MSVPTLLSRHLRSFLRPSGLSIDQRRHLLSIFLLIGLTLMASRLLTNAYLWLTTSSPERATRTLGNAIAMLISVVLWMLNKRGNLTLTASLYLLTYLFTAFFISTDTAWQDTLILFAIPIAVASFLLGPYASFTVAALSAVAYWLSYQARGFPVGYNSALIPAFFILAAISWLISSFLERALSKVQQTEEALQETTQALQALIQASPLPIVALDADSRVKIWNPAAERMFGWKAEEALGQPHPIVSPEKQEEHGALRARVLQGETLTNVEARRRKKDGSPIDISLSIAPLRDAQGRITGMVGVLSDLTERKRMEEALRRQNAYLTALHETTLGLIHHMDLSELLTAIVARAASLVGTSHGFLYLVAPDGKSLTLQVGLGIYTKYTHTRLQKGEGLSGKVWESGRPLKVDDYSAWPGRSPQFEGDVFHAAVGVPLFRDGEVTGVIGAGYLEPGRTFGEAEVDILSRFAQLAAIALDNARLHASLQETNAQLREALQAKEEMIQNVSHELRTPLTLIKGYAETLLGGLFGELDEKTREAIAIINRKAETLTRLVNSLLTLQTFSPDDLQLGPVDVKALLDSLGQDWRRRAREVQVELEVCPADAPLTVQADADRLREVLDQLLDNALKFRQEGGRVRLEAAETGRKIRLAVSDDGIGIPPDKLDKVFERFYQVDGSSKRRYGGAGIGLTLVRTIVAAHGGQVWAESPGWLGRGTTVVVELPASQGAQGEAKPPPASSSYPNSGGGKSLGNISPGKPGMVEE